MNTSWKSPSQRRVVVIAVACAVLAAAMTPASAAVIQGKAHLVRKAVPAARTHGGVGGGLFSLEFAMTAVLRP